MDSKQARNMTGDVQHGVSRFTDEDIYLFREGNHFRLYDHLGSHLMEHDGKRGTYFAVWAPNAKQVSVMGDFNGWNRTLHPLAARWDGSGIWEGFIPGIGNGEVYKYYIVSQHRKYTTERRDPFAFYSEVPPRTASIVWDLDHQWGDQQWMDKRGRHNDLNAPVSVYEVHLGSWRRSPDDPERILTCPEVGDDLVKYLKDMNYTHVEFLPLMEHPFYGSWGYQTIGYFAPSSRYGTPQDFMGLVQKLHDNDIGVILDWVPSHFPSDGHGLAYFDGTNLYEHSDPRKGFHPDWKSYIFNYGRNETRAFLISSALFWMDKYHADGIRVDAVASMLYLDYSRKHGEWIPNEHGGRENIEAINFLKQLNKEIYTNFPGTQVIAEESTSWPMVSRPTYMGGLGFGMKWNMGWMHDTLEYFKKDPIYRKYHHNQLSFSLVYAFTENFMLSLSHDEVVHGKGSLFNKMPGDDWQKFANLRLLYGYMYGHPGKKLLFMGQEFAQPAEWNHDRSLDWHLLDHAPHQQLQRWLKELNYFYKTEPALYERDFDHQGFEWVDCRDWERGIVAFLRKDNNNDMILVVCNFTPAVLENYKLGIPGGGFWREVLNSDAAEYGGSGKGNLGGVAAAPLPAHGQFYSLSLTIPPLGIVFFKNDKGSS
ncbi:MAG: 1,4-alpha-glucan branching protein GlgB [Candidatus Omnitrophota bacterium]